MNAKQLKDSILQYAMQGKLVHQDPNDEPASELLKRIAAEKERLILNKVIKKEKLLPSINEELQFDIPSTWEWVRLGEVARWGAGSTPNRSNREYYGGEIPWLKTGELTDGYISQSVEFITEKALKECSLSLNPKGSILMAMYGATIGKLGILDFEATTNQACCAGIPYNGLYNKFLFYYLMASRSLFIKAAEGGAQPNISRQKIVAFPMPLPPYEEQKRIVEKVEGILPKIKEYDDAHLALEKYNNSIPISLERSILQYAMQGKLVEQDPNDELAQQLIENIKYEKEQLIKDKIIKKEKPLPPIIEEDIPFDIPSNWEWVRLGEISTYIQRGKSPIYSNIEKIPVISQKCIQWSGFTMEPAKFIDPETLNKYDKIRFLKTNDILWNSTGLGTIGRVGLFDSSINPYIQAVADSHVTIVRTSGLVDPKYIYYYLASPTIQDSIEEVSSGSTKQKELNTSTIKCIMIPLPSLNEQKRIVQAIEKMLRLKERL
ncbi:restriction endonuclease subunit S (plasmid) [Paenibacillus peoriae]|uniref:restriction endonuclease subunit S n=1 Tax=Paenibacillus peoriae TaxID=59893 RepID=UPI0032AF5B4E